jgi:hypothetical protein
MITPPSILPTSENTQGALSVRFGNAALDATFVGPLEGWRWTVLVVVVIVVAFTLVMR